MPFILREKTYGLFGQPGKSIKACSTYPVKALWGTGNPLPPREDTSHIIITSLLLLEISGIQRGNNEGTRF